MTILNHRFANAGRLTACIILLTIVMSIVTTSCRSSHSTGSTGSDYADTTSVAQTLTQNRLKELFGQLESGYTEWTDVKIPVTLTLNSPKSFSINGTLSMERNRSIHLSFRFFGMEVASLMVTTDSVYAVYKMDRIYLAESLGDFLGGFPATVGNVQDLLLGRPFVLGEDSARLSQCRLAGDGSKWVISPKHSPSGIGYDFTVDTPTGSIESLTVTLPSRRPVSVRYFGVETTASGAMASLASVTIESSKSALEGEISLSPRKSVWDKGNAKTWSVPRGYKRVRLAEILEKMHDSKQ